MFDQHEKPPFEDTFNPLNESWTNPGGSTQGFVTKVYHDLHRVDVYLPEFNFTAYEVPVKATWAAGPGTGTHNLPSVGTPVEVEKRQGKSAGMGKFLVTGVVNTGDNPPPMHPSLKGQENYWAMQGKVGVPGQESPGSLQMMDEQGGMHTLAMGKVTHQGQGLGDQRDKGLSITQAEQHGIKAANGTALANDTANRLDPSDMANLSKGFNAISGQLSNALRATTNAGSSFADQVTGQAEATALAKSAAGLASGNPSYDSLI